MKANRIRTECDSFQITVFGGLISINVVVRKSKILFDLKGRYFVSAEQLANYKRCVINFGQMLEDTDTNVSISTLKRTLCLHKLEGCTTKDNSLLNNRHIEEKLQFAWEKELR